MSIPRKDLQNIIFFDFVSTRNRADRPGREPSAVAQYPRSFRDHHFRRPSRNRPRSRLHRRKRLNPSRGHSVGRCSARRVRQHGLGTRRELGPSQNLLRRNLA